MFCPDHIHNCFIISFPFHRELTLKAFKNNSLVTFPNLLLTQVTLLSYLISDNCIPQAAQLRIPGVLDHPHQHISRSSICIQIHSKPQDYHSDSHPQIMTPPFLNSIIALGFTKPCDSLLNSSDFPKT